MTEEVMMSDAMDQRLSRAFWLVVGLQSLIWIVFPAWFRFALPMDINEAGVWGAHLQFGYDRDPYLIAWVARLAWIVQGWFSETHQQAMWVMYAFARLFVVLGVYATWRLGRLVTDPYRALLAAVGLLSIQYYHLGSIDFNDNVLELGLWPLMMWSAYVSLTRNRLLHWSLLGIVLGLGLMAKYYTVFLVFVLLMFVCYRADCRRWVFRAPGFYIALLIAVAFCIPHLHWLMQYDYITMRYSAGKLDASHLGLWAHIWPGLRFCVMQVLNFLPFVVLFALSCCCQRQAISDDEVMPPPFLGHAQGLGASFNRQYIIFMAFGVICLTVLFAWIRGWQVNTMWGMPLLSAWGLIMLMCWRRPLGWPRVRLMCQMIVVVNLLIAGIYGYRLMQPGNHSSANMPVAALADKVASVWQGYSDEPIRYVAGDRYLGGYLRQQLPSHPSVFIDFHRQWHSQWTDVAALRKFGAVFILPAHQSFSAALKQRFPLMDEVGVVKIPRHRGGELMFRLAVLPPDASGGWQGR